MDRETGEFSKVSATRAFNLQQGSMLHWIDTGRGAELTHNDWDGGRTVSRAIALGDRSSRIIGRAIAAVSTDGTAAMGLSYSPDGQWIACDTAPRGPDHSSEVMLYEVTGNRKVSLGFYRSEEIFRGEIRCDLHPRWTPDGRGLTIDAVPEGNRQIPLIDVSDVVG